jgi:hypothetical protein
MVRTRPQTMEMSNNTGFSGRADATATRLSAERASRGESADLVQDVAASTTVWHCPLAASFALLIVSGNRRWQPSGGKRRMPDILGSRQPERSDIESSCVSLFGCCGGGPTIGLESRLRPTKTGPAHSTRIPPKMRNRGCRPRVPLCSETLV